MKNLFWPTQISTITLPRNSVRQEKLESFVEMDDYKEVVNADSVSVDMVKKQFAQDDSFLKCLADVSQQLLKIAVDKPTLDEVASAMISIAKRCQEFTGKMVETFIDQVSACAKQFDSGTTMDLEAECWTFSVGQILKMLHAFAPDKDFNPILRAGAMVRDKVPDFGVLADQLSALLQFVSWLCIATGTNPH